MVTINGKTNQDYFCDHIHTEISAPAPKRMSVDIPLRDGVVDLTENLSPVIFYEERKITIGLELRALREEWPMIYSRLLADIHGQQVQVEFLEDSNFYWLGWASVSALKDNRATAGITITVTARPFKRYKETETIYSGTLSGDMTLTVRIDMMRGYLEFSAGNANGTVTFDGQTWSLPQGDSTAYGLTLMPGDNVLTIHGSGTAFEIKKTEATL